MKRIFTKNWLILAVIFGTAASVQNAGVKLPLPEKTVGAHMRFISAKATDVYALAASLENIRLEYVPSLMPVEGAYISSGFGPRRNPVDGLYKQHFGLDLPAVAGTPVLATAAGVVSAAGYTEQYGLIVEIDHLNGIKTRYAHNSGLLVYRDMRVEKGQVIAKVGATGDATGNHVHYEVHVQGRPVNPEGYFPKGQGPGSKQI